LERETAKAAVGAALTARPAGLREPFARWSADRRLKRRPSRSAADGRPAVRSRPGLVRQNGQPPPALAPRPN